MIESAIHTPGFLMYVALVLMVVLCAVTIYLEVKKR